MPNFTYTEGLNKLQTGGIDWDADDIRFLLVDNTSTCGAEPEKATLSGFTTLGRLVGPGYPVADLPLSGNIAINDGGNNRVRLDCDDAQFVSIDAGTAEAFVIYKFVSSDADSVPLFFSDGKHVVTSSAPAAQFDIIIYVDPLDDEIPNGQTITFDSGDAVLSSPAARGDRSIAVTSLAQAIGIAETGEADTGIFPVITNNTDVNFIFNTIGVATFDRQKTSAL